MWRPKMCNLISRSSRFSNYSRQKAMKRKKWKWHCWTIWSSIRDPLIIETMCFSLLQFGAFNGGSCSATVNDLCIWWVCALDPDGIHHASVRYTSFATVAGQLSLLSVPLADRRQTSWRSRVNWGVSETVGDAMVDFIGDLVGVKRWVVYSDNLNTLGIIVQLDF